MPRTKDYKRVESPEGRRRCAAHAVSQLFAWDAPVGAPGDWAPSTVQVITKTRQLYGWVTLTEDEAVAAIQAHVAERATTARAAA